MKYKSGQPVICEECNEILETVDDYVIPGYTGPKSCSDDLCGYCDWGFTVRKDKDGTFDVQGKK